MRQAARWGPDDIGDLTGRTAVVTGAGVGLGFEVALELGAHGAHVVLAFPSIVKAEQAADRIVGAAPDSSVETLSLDLSSQESVRRGAARFVAEHERIDVLVTGTGLEPRPVADHLGPFALTGLLLDTLLRTTGSRIVTVGPPHHRLHRVARPSGPASLAGLASTDAGGSDGLAGTGGGRGRQRNHATSGLVGMAFTRELDRRLRAAGAGTLAVAAHSGRLGRSVVSGAVPVLYAATAPGVEGGDCFGPRSVGRPAGPPARARAGPRSHGPDAVARLWRAAEELTGVRYDLTVGAPETRT